MLVRMAWKAQQLRAAGAPKRPACSATARYTWLQQAPELMPTCLRSTEQLQPPAPSSGCMLHLPDMLHQRPCLPAVRTVLPQLEPWLMQVLPCLVLWCINTHHPQPVTMSMSIEATHSNISHRPRHLVNPPPHPRPPYPYPHAPPTPPPHLPAQASVEVMRVLHSCCPRAPLEKASIDEAYLDVTEVVVREPAWLAACSTAASHALTGGMPSCMNPHTC